MSILLEVITKLLPTVQPLVFETNVDEYPYSTSGTVFLVGYKGKGYVITTRHGLNPENPPAICIFPSDISQRIFPLGHVFFVPQNIESDDYMDLAIIDILSSSLESAELAQATIINLDLAYEADWTAAAEEMEFFTIGYPSELSEVNFETQELRTDRIALIGRYEKSSPFPYMHELAIHDNLNLESFSGFSGAPVFAIRTSKDQRPKPLLCGMAIRGTPKSGLIHFLDVSVLLDALAIKRQHESDVV